MTDPGPTSVVGAAPPPAVGPTTETLPVVPMMPPAAGMPDMPDETGWPPATQKTTPFMTVRPVSAGTLLVLSDGRTVVASDPDRDQVYIVDLQDQRFVGAVTLRPSDEPGRIVEDGDGLVHVALRGGGAIATIAPDHGLLLARRALCAAPRGLAVDKTLGELHVACAGGELVTIATAPATTKPRRTIQLDRDLRDVIVKGSRVLVSTFRSAGIIAVEADGTIGTRTAPDAVTSTRATSSVAWRMIQGPDGDPVVLHERGQVGPVGITPGGYGRGLTCGSIVTSAISIVSIDQRATLSGPNLDALVAADIALSPDGKEFAVVSIGGGDQGRQVDFYPVQGTDQNIPFTCVTGAGAPHAPDSGDGQVLASAALPAPGLYLPPNGEVVAVAYDARGNVIVQSRQPANLQILTQRIDPIALSSDARSDAGHQLFHTATAGRIACVSCHPEGGEDGRVWNFQSLGPRRTQSLRGGIMATAPFHWNGDQHDFSALMGEVFQSRMGGGSVEPARVVALARWLDQVPRIPTSEPADAEAFSRGRAVFAKAGCGACHAGADFTNNQSVDVGTGGAFQVPQLHGVSFRAPYMHSGCAPTLEARFNNPSCGGDARHGAVAGLSKGQIDDLISYLDTL